MQYATAAANATHVVDDALAGRRIGDDPAAIVRPVNAGFAHPSVIVRVGRTYIAVHSYLDVLVYDDEAIELAEGYYAEAKLGPSPDLPSVVFRLESSAANLEGGE